MPRNADPEAPPQGIVATCRDWYEAHAPTWEPYWDAIDNEDAFAEGDRYAQDTGAHNRDTRLAQIRGQEIQDTVRHFAAEATAKPRSVEARGGDSDLAEIAVAMVDRELRDPWKGFETHYYEAIHDARQRRLGIVWLDWYPKYGRYGEMFYRSMDPRRCLWDECYDPHHPLCEVFVEKRRMPVAWIHDTFPKAKWVKPDSEWKESRGGRKLEQGVPIRLMVGGQTLRPTGSTKDGKAELWFFWWKNDPTYAQRETGRDLEIPKPMRYLACRGTPDAPGCGFRSPTQGELARQGKPQELPPRIDSACPRCGGMLERIDSFAEEEAVLRYPSGKRLVVIAPFSSGPDDAPVYDGKWPIPRMRSFPGTFFSAYLAPRRPMGCSAPAIAM